MGLFLLYAAGIAGVIWYTLYYLPFPELTRHFGFALNIVQFGFLSLLSFLVYRQETHFRSIFFQFWILFASFALLAPAIYQSMYLWDWQGGVRAFTILQIYVHFLFTWTICKILLHYVFHDEKRWIVNTLSIVVVLPLYLWLFWPYYLFPLKLLELPTGQDAATLYHPIHNPLIVVNIVSLVFLVAFFLHKLKTDRPIGVFADTILALFGLFIAIDTVEMIAQVSKPNLLNMTQWAFGIVVSAMLIVLVLRLKYKSQSIANYYESQCLSNDPRVGRRVGFFDRFVLWCFFNPKEVGKRIYLDTRHKNLTVKRSSPRVSRPIAKN
ncbi:MAG: hypothetical protein ACOZB3_04520 [Calditrichota bacterium]